jgi:hypothetical protein
MACNPKVRGPLNELIERGLAERRFAVSIPAG